MNLTLSELRKANLERLKVFKNAKGQPAHSEPDGSDWSPSDWLQAVIGELGEYANLMKKVQRGDHQFEAVKEDQADELADTLIYLDLLAARIGVNLEDAVISKWNRVSERIGSSLRIPTEGSLEDVLDALEKWHSDHQNKRLPFNEICLFSAFEVYKNTKQENTL
jgi:NTP pyrophosphatase (non-canonical NTP hydrolase)